jgi:hypothetical protein
LEGNEFFEVSIFIGVESEFEACIKSEEIFDEACSAVRTIFERFDTGEGESGEVDLLFEV